MRQPGTSGDPRFYVDVTTTDFRKVSDHFEFYRNYTVYNWATGTHKGRDRSDFQGLKVTCRLCILCRCWSNMLMCHPTFRSPIRDGQGLFID